VQLTLFLTRKCNARCRFCFYLPAERTVTPEPELSLAEIEKISRSLGDLLWLAFSGGEPFLRQDLVEIAEVFYRRNRPCIILIPTNGLLSDVIVQNTEEILKRCPRSTVAVKLSLDGPADVHNRLRGVPGAFGKTMETFKRLRELAGRYSNFELGINSVLCSENQDRMDELMSTVNKLEGVRAHTVSLIRGEVAEGQLKKVAPAVYARICERLARDLRNRTAGRYRFSGAGLKAAQDILQRRLIHRTLVEQKRQIPCFAGTLALVLTETGDAYPCESFTMNMGNIREYGGDVKKLLESEGAQKVMRSVRQSGCYCTHECNTMMNILFNPRLYPGLIAEYLRLQQKPVIPRRVSA
jgi:radical SAM protein with 4Fe4S-binding SPASM domain